MPRIFYRTTVNPQSAFMRPATNNSRVPSLRATFRSFGRWVPGTSRRLRNMYRSWSLFTHPADYCPAAV